MSPPPTQFSEYLNPCCHATIISTTVQYTMIPGIIHCHKEEFMAHHFHCTPEWGKISQLTPPYCLHTKCIVGVIYYYTYTTFTWAVVPSSWNYQSPSFVPVPLSSIKHIHYVTYWAQRHKWTITEKLMQDIPDGMWIVFGPAFCINLFTKRMLANVPLAMTSSLPRRLP